MTANQFIARRKKLFPTQAAAAKAMGISDSRINHYEKGRRPIPEWAVRMSELLERERDSSSRLSETIQAQA